MTRGTSGESYWLGEPSSRSPGHEGVWVAAGYSEHGNVLGLACGELLAGAILGRPAPELQLFDPGRLL